MGRTGPRLKPYRIWSGLSESNRHLNLGKVREIKSNALERRHLAFFRYGLNRNDGKQEPCCFLQFLVVVAFEYSQRDSTSRGELLQALAGARLEKAKTDGETRS